MGGGRKAFLRKWFWFGCGATGLGTILILLLSSGWLGFRLFQLEWKPQGQTDLAFREVALGFTNVADLNEKTGSLPFMAGVVIDIDRDGRDEVVLGGGRGQPDGVFGYVGDVDLFTDLASVHDIAKASGDATMGGVSVDLDSDGWPELLLVRESGLWVHDNEQGRLRTGRLVFTSPDADKTTLLSIAPGDVNGDGLTDLYLSGYIQNAHVEGETIFTRPYGGYSYLLIGRADRSFSDETEAWGLRRQHNTFTALFADLDGDGDSDLVVAQDTGVIETWRNDGAPPLVRLENPSVNSYPMGLAAGDFTGDGTLDLYASNVGHTLPEAMLRGDLPGEAEFNPDYMLFSGDGAGGFADVARQMGAARIGFGWGVVAADFNLDGWEDIAVAQNYAKFGQPAIIHRYASKILQNYDGKTFRPVEKRAGASNRLFAISPLIGDFNGDGRPDLIWANLNGPARALLNATPDTRSITLRFDDSIRAYGAQIVVQTRERTMAWLGARFLETVHSAIFPSTEDRPWTTGTARHLARRRPRPRRPRAHNAGDGGAVAGGSRRLSVKRKLALVQRLLRGESLEAVSREENVPVHRLTAWRDKVLLGAESALKERERDARDEEIARLQAKAGEITMEFAREEIGPIRGC